MKPLWKILCLSGYFIIVVSSFVMAQCGTLQSITYDTLATGTGNNSHVFSLSKFDPSVGTLVSARINSVISVNYGFTLKNVDSIQRDFSVDVGRYDNFSSSAMGTPYTNLMNVPLGSFLLNPGDTVSHLPATILSRYVQSDSIVYDMVNFLGNGTVAFNYTPITYTDLTGSNVYYYSATASDTIRFSVTYFYCTEEILSVGLINFFAKKEDPENIQLSWQTLNEITGRNYEIQKSTDGKNFSDLGLIASAVGDNSTGSYLYNYVITPSDNNNNKIYFRIKITDASAKSGYSATREVDLDKIAGDILLYPNPSADFINVVLNNAANWQINIYAVNGILLQNDQFANTNAAHIVFKQKPAAGIYFMRILNQQTQKNFIQSFMVR